MRALGGRFGASDCDAKSALVNAGRLVSHGPVTDRLRTLFETLFQAHPWHGVRPRIEGTTSLRAYVEIVPSDTVKYELDKASGHLRIDRPQRFSSTCPTLYGFFPQTYCGETVAARCVERGGGGGEETMVGDGDPLDLCILTEKTFSQGDFLAHVRPIGGLRMVDKNEVDDKIVAVLEDDVAYGHLEDLGEAPQGLIDRLRHYFLSYKQRPEELAQDAPLEQKRVRIAEVYGRDEALEVIRRSEVDYAAKFGEPDARWAEFEALLRRSN